MPSKKSGQSRTDEFVEVFGAGQNNLKNIDVEIPRHKFVVFTGISGSGKSSLAFETIYAESQRRYFESIAPYARRLLDQLPAPRVREIRGLPPAVALQQRRSEANLRSSVGTITKISNSLRMLFSRAGQYPVDAATRLDSDAFSANTLVGACVECHGVGVLHKVSESSLVPDPNLSIRQQAIAAWPGAWQGKNYRDILATLGYDIDKPWKDLPKKDRDWILFTDEKPVVTVYAEREAHRIQRPYKGTYMSAAAYVKHTFASTNSTTLRKRVMRFMDRSNCPACNGKRLKAESLAVKFAGYDIAELNSLPLSKLAEILKEALAGRNKTGAEELETAKLIGGDLLERIAIVSELGLDYLSLDRATPTLSAGELQRLRLSSQLRSGLFGVVYVLDEPSAGLHPADSKALLKIMQRLLGGGNSLFVVEHDLDMIAGADWVVDMGPAAGDGGGELLYSGEIAGLKKIRNSHTGSYLAKRMERGKSKERKDRGKLLLKNITRNNLHSLDAEIPVGVLTVVTGVSGSGKSTLVSQVLCEIMSEKLGLQEDAKEAEDEIEDLLSDETNTESQNGRILIDGYEHFKRLVIVDQKPIGRTPRSNLATYTGLFDTIRQLLAATDIAKNLKFNASRFSFNVADGRCEHCQGEGYVSVELLFLPGLFTPCSICRGTRYNEETLKVKYLGKNVAEILELSVESASEFFKETPSLARGLATLQELGLSYLKLGQPATDLSGGEAQRIKLACELQKQQKGNTLYILDEPSTGLHPYDVDNLMKQIQILVDKGNTAVLVEHDLSIISQADWVIDLGPGAGENGGRITSCGTPTLVAKDRKSITGKFLAAKIPGLS